MQTGQHTLSVSEAARELGISADWLRQGEKRSVLPLARRKSNEHRYYTLEDLEQLRNREFIERDA